MNFCKYCQQPLKYSGEHCEYCSALFLDILDALDHHVKVTSKILYKMLQNAKIQQVKRALDRR